MEPFRLKLKVGPHEFEAEGSQENVEKQLAIWRELIGSPLISAPALASPPPPAPATATPAVTPIIPPALNGLPESREDFSKLFKHDGRVVSLTVLPTGEQREADALLLLMLGQRVFNGAEQVGGSALNDGLSISGLTVERIDRAWGGHLAGNVIRTGVRRGVKYRLTHPGLARAKELAAGLLAMVP